MNKLPHEKLREFVDSSGCKGCNHLASMAGSDCDEFDTYTDCINAVATGIADEIEKYYDPKLHFVDGELVNEGDKYVDQFGHECTISRIDICVRIWDENGEYENVDVHKPLKRPEPKALDADGVETNAGDTVYTKSGIKCTVEKIGTQQCEGMEDWDGTPWIMFDNGSWMHAHDVTHREPDSLEKLLFELRGVDFIPSKDYLNHIADRLAAIMERDA